MAAEIITARFDYSIAPLVHLIIAALMIGYFVLPVRMQGKKNRDVIAEMLDSN